MSASTFQDFIALSVVVTGFTSFDLLGTGQAESYFSTISQIVGEVTMDELAHTFRSIQIQAGSDTAALENLLRGEILCDDELSLQ